MRLEAEQVTKQYQTDPKKARFAYALSRTDLVVESGEFAVITGKSGSGKSTLLHILAGLLQPPGISMKRKKSKTSCRS